MNRRKKAEIGTNRVTKRKEMRKKGTEGNEMVKRLTVFIVA